MLAIGQRAPEFTLDRLDGGVCTLSGVLAAGPAVLVFFKASCPTCQLALPFLDRLRGGGLQIFAVSQDDEARTREFLRLFPVKLPVLLDRPGEGYTASCAFGIRFVPTLFVIERDGTVSQACEAFDRGAYEDVARRAGRTMFEPGEAVPLYKPG